MVNRQRTSLAWTSLALGISVATAAVAATPAAVDTSLRVAIDRAAIDKALVPTPTELFDLYQGRTWQWQAGGAYFSPRPRDFTAWSQADGQNTYAKGRWLISTDGQVCFKAKWFTAKGAASGLTCFAHRRVDSTIYQRRLPGGDWYVFKAASPQLTQEYAKFKMGDEVSAEAEKVKAEISAAAN